MKITVTASNFFSVTDSEDYDSDDEDETATTSQATPKKPKTRTANEGNDSEASEGGEAVGEPCAICLGRMKGNIGSPEGCDHSFCLDCILEWARVSSSKSLFWLDYGRRFGAFALLFAACFCFKINFSGISTYVCDSHQQTDVMCPQDMFHLWRTRAILL